jgi:xyloglucan-specific exo-beta-1,4-glucanase
MTRDLGAPLSTWSFEVDGLEETVPLDAVSVPGVPLISVLGDYDGFVHDDLGASPSRGRYQPTIGTTRGLAVASGDRQRVARVGSALYLSKDGAGTWLEVPRPTTDEGGHLALSADGAVLLWTVGDTVRRTADEGISWSVASGVAGETFPVADSVEADRFYAYDPEGGGFYVSTDAAQSFTATATLAPGGASRFASVPGVAGDVWVALQFGGLSRSVDGGTTFERIAAVDSCRAVGFGAPAPDQLFPAVYIWGAASGGARGLYRSDDAGVTWIRINDDAHEYGGPGNGEFVFGDVNTYGRVFMSSAGRGLVVGDKVADPAP